MSRQSLFSNSASEQVLPVPPYTMGMGKGERRLVERDRVGKVTPAGPLPAREFDYSQEGTERGEVEQSWSFHVPKGKDEEGNSVGMLAWYNVTGRVDDWLEVEIDGQIALDMTENAEPAGIFGGHQRWTRSDKIRVKSGDHTLRIKARNTDTQGAVLNVFFFRVTVKRV